jgi:hypothetical protein
MDPADEADQQVENLNDIARAMRKPSGPLATGVCAWCDEPVDAGKRWCDVQCRNDWDKAEGRRSGEQDA